MCAYIFLYRLMKDVKYIKKLPQYLFYFSNLPHPIQVFFNNQVPVYWACLYSSWPLNCRHVYCWLRLYRLVSLSRSWSGSCSWTLPAGDAEQVRIGFGLPLRLTPLQLPLAQSCRQTTRTTCILLRHSVNLHPADRYTRTERRVICSKISQLFYEFKDGKIYDTLKGRNNHECRFCNNYN